MQYHYYERDSIQRKLTPVRIVRKAEKQSGSFAVLATEDPDKIPLVFPDDSSVSHVVGSVLVRVQEQRLVGVVGFASDEQAQAVRQRYAAGEYKLHLVTCPIAGIELRSGERFNGVDGPAVLLTSWEPLQAVLG